MNRTIAALLLVLFAAFPAFAQTGASPDQTGSHDEGAISRTTNEVSNEVMSPFCPGKTLAMCPSPAAAEVRRDIQEMARDGMGTEEIKQTLITEYGDEFEIVEPDRFDNTLIFSLIAAGLVLCVVVVLWISRRRGSGEADDDGDEGSGGSGPGNSGDRGDPGSGPTGADGDVDDSYLSALRDEYRS